MRHQMLSFLGVTPTPFQWTWSSEYPHAFQQIFPIYSLLRCWYHPMAIPFSRSFLPEIVLAFLLLVANQIFIISFIVVVVGVIFARIIFIQWFIFNDFILTSFFSSFFFLLHFFPPKYSNGRNQSSEDRLRDYRKILELIERSSEELLRVPSSDQGFIECLKAIRRTQIEMEIEKALGMYVNGVMLNSFD